MDFIRARWLLLVLVGGMASPVRSRGDDAAGLVGRRVVQRDARFQLRDDARAVDSKGRLPIYRVEKAHGDRLWLTAPGLAGWALKSDVVPVERGIEFFTGQIRADPANDFAYLMRAMLWKDRVDLDRALGDLDEAVIGVNYFSRPTTIIFPGPIGGS